MRHLLLLALWIAMPATEWYVSTTGSDGNAGTSSASAFGSLGKATAVLQPGDTVWVAPGTYHPSAAASVWQKAGSAAHPILISGMPGQARPVFDCGGYASSGVYLGGSTSASSYITIRRLAFRNTGDHAITAQDVDDLTIEDCELGWSQWNGIWVQNSARTVIRRNWLHDNCESNNPERSDAVWGQGIGVPGCTDTLIEGNLVERNRGEGIDAYAGAERVRMVANAVFDTFSVGYYLDRARYCTVERNFLRSSNSAYYRAGNPANAFVIADETLGDQPDKASIGNIVRNNVGIGCQIGFYWGHYTADGRTPIGMRQTVVANNALSGATNMAVTVDTAAGHTGNRFANNLLRRASGYSFSYVMAQNDYVPVAGVLAFDHNAWWDSTVVLHGALGSPRVTSDPMLVAIGGTTPWSQAPAAGSPLIGAGVALAEVTDDFQGRPRPIGTASEIGAFESPGSGVNEVTLALPAGATSAERVFTTWDWGDGTAAYTTVGLTSGHRYAVGGSYTLTTTVRDPEHGTATSATATVTASTPVLVTIASADASAAEVGSAPAVFTAVRTGSTASALTVSYAVAGSAVAGTDYAALPGVVTIPAGAASTTVQIVPVDDTSVEGDETVVVTVAGGSGYAVGSPASVTLTIVDRPAAGGSSDGGSGGGGGGGCGAGAAGLLALGLLGLRRRSRAR